MFMANEPLKLSRHRSATICRRIVAEMFMANEPLKPSVTAVRRGRWAGCRDVYGE